MTVNRLVSFQRQAMQIHCLCLSSKARFALFFTTFWSTQNRPGYYSVCV